VTAAAHHAVATAHQAVPAAQHAVTAAAHQAVPVAHHAVTAAHHAVTAATHQAAAAAHRVVAAAHRAAPAGHQAAPTHHVAGATAQHGNVHANPRGIGNAVQHAIGSAHTIANTVMHGNANVHANAQGIGNAVGHAIGSAHTIANTVLHGIGNAPNIANARLHGIGNAVGNLTAQVKHGLGNAASGLAHLASNVGHQGPIGNVVQTLSNVASHLVGGATHAVNSATQHGAVGIISGAEHLVSGAMQGIASLAGHRLDTHPTVPPGNPYQDGHVYRVDAAGHVQQVNASAVPQGAIVYTNGMRPTAGYATQSAATVSQNNHDQPVYLVYNGNQGSYLQAGARAVSSGHDPNTQNPATSTLVGILEQDHGNVTLMGHSQGGALDNNAVYQYSRQGGDNGHGGTANTHVDTWGGVSSPNVVHEVTATGVHETNFVHPLEFNTVHLGPISFTNPIPSQTGDVATRIAGGTTAEVIHNGNQTTVLSQDPNTVAIPSAPGQKNGHDYSGQVGDTNPSDAYKNS
jgi:hypothetical protein